MFLRILWETFFRRKTRASLALLALAMGTSLATALLSTLVNIEERLAQELRAYGANLLVKPKAESLAIEIAGVRITPAGAGGYLDEANLVNLKTIFWRNNILGFAPFLSVPVQAGPKLEPTILTGTWFEKDIRVPKGTPIRTQFAGEQPLPQDISLLAGVKAISPWWHVDGAWPGDEDPQGALVGDKVAKRLGLAKGWTFPVLFQGQERTLEVRGILYTGGLEEDQIYVGLPVAQGLMGLSRGMDRAAVSALTQPRPSSPLTSATSALRI